MLILTRNNLNNNRYINYINMNNKNFPYKTIEWKTLCHSKANLTKLKWWYNKESKEYWLFALSEDCHKIFILNALSGKYIKSLGNNGDKVGEFDKPIDLCVYENFLMVLEKDNNRVQIFSLPELNFISILGEVELSNPKTIECLKLKKKDKEYCCLIVGDNLDNKPSRRKCYFKFIFEIDKLGIYVPEVLRVEPKNNELGRIESIKYDSIKDNLFIVDKLTKNIKILDFNNNYKNTIMNNTYKGEPGEINILNDNKRDGIIVIGDFSRLDSFFHLYTINCEYLMSLSSETTLKNNCFCIINHNHNKILYTTDEDDCVLAYRMIEINELSKNKIKSKVKVKSKFDNIKEIGAIGVLGTAVAAAFYLKK